MVLAVLGFLKRIMKRRNEQNRRTSQSGPKESTRVLQPAYTVRLKPEPEEQAAVVHELTISWAGLTDIGRVRDHNEDTFSQLDLGERSFFVVADGMGGHDAGEIASRMAAAAACEEIRKAGTEEDARRLVERAVKQANAEVNREGSKRNSNMGTTLSVVLLEGGVAHIANVGDSRAYWIENGSITQITEDHSLVARLVAAGKLSREEARGHPRSNLLYRTIGGEENVTVDTFRIPLKKGGSLLLCSDGLWGEVRDEEIHRVFAAEQDVKRVCAGLVRMANENGGKDNITAIVVKVE